MKEIMNIWEVVVGGSAMQYQQKYRRRNMAPRMIQKKFVETHLFGRLEKYEIIGLKG